MPTLIDSLFQLAEPFLKYMADPDLIKRNTPTLKEQESAERFRKKFLKKNNRCCSCKCE